MSLPEIEIQLKSETTPIMFGDQKVAELGEFWRWGFSNLLDNVLRGALAEFIVGRALEIKRDGAVRKNWTTWDLEFRDLKVEVKSAAYFQWWHQENPSTITFGVRPTKKWNSEKNKYEPELNRHADVYVFCLLESADPLNLNHWKFFVVETENLPKTKSLGLSKLKKLCHSPFTFKTLKCRMEEIQNARRNF